MDWLHRLWVGVTGRSLTALDPAPVPEVGAKRQTKRIGAAKPIVNQTIVPGGEGTPTSPFNGLLDNEPMSDPDAQPEPTLQQTAMDGTEVVGGFIRDEYLARIADVQKRMQTYDRMRKAEVTIDAALTATELPLIRASYEVEPASQDPADLEIADNVRHNLFEKISFPKLIEQAATMAQYGFAAFQALHEIEDWAWSVEAQKKAQGAARLKTAEGIEEQADVKEVDRPGMVSLKKVADLTQKSFYRWRFNGNGDLVRIEQLGWYFETDGRERYGTKDVDPATVALLTHKQRGANVEGISMLRSIFREFEAMDTLVKLELIAFERYAVGTPVMTLPERATEQDKAIARKIVRSYRSHQEAGVTLPFGFTFDIKEADLKTADFQAAMTHKKAQMLLRFLAQFLGHGADGQSGNRALSGNQIDFFIALLWALGENIADGITKQIVKPLVDMNYDTKRYPKLKLVQIVDKDVTAALTQLSTAVTAGLITPYPALQSQIATMLDLPPMPEQTDTTGDAPAPGDLKPEPKPAEPAADSVRPPAPPEKPPQPGQLSQAQADVRFHRPLTTREERAGGLRHFADVQDQLDAAEASFLKDAKGITERQRLSMVKTIQKAVNSGKLVPLGRLAVPHMDEYEALLSRHLSQLAHLGQEQVAKEMEQAAPTVNQLKDWSSVRATLLADKHESDLRTQVVGGVLDAIAEARLKKDTAQHLSLTFSQQVLQGDWQRMLSAMQDVVGGRE